MFKDFESEASEVTDVDGVVIDRNTTARGEFLDSLDTLGLEKVGSAQESKTFMKITEPSGTTRSSSSSRPRFTGRSTSTRTLFGRVKAG